MKEQKPYNENRVLKFFLIFSILIVVILFVLTPILITKYYGKPPKDPASFGDMFGVVNAFFSSLAFALLIYSSIMQRIELKLQRKELEWTRKEFEKSVLAQQELVKLQQRDLEMKLMERTNDIKPLIDELDFLFSSEKNVQNILRFKILNNTIFIERAEVFQNNKIIQEILFGKYYLKNENVEIEITDSLDLDIDFNLILYLSDIDNTEYFVEILIKDKKAIIKKQLSKVV